MAETKVIRLTKAAREFNVGRETIVEFLENKGFKIDVNPNAKLTPEMVDLLAQEYSNDQSVKEEARKKGLGSVKRESISLEDRKRPAQDMDDVDEEADIIIRGMSVKVDEKFKRSVEPGSHHREEQISQTPPPAKEVSKTPVEETKPEPEKEAPVSAETKPEPAAAPEIKEAKPTQEEVKKTEADKKEPAPPKAEAEEALSAKAKTEVKPTEAKAEPEVVKDTTPEKEESTDAAKTEKDGPSEPPKPSAKTAPEKETSPQEETAPDKTAVDKDDKSKKIEQKVEATPNEPKVLGKIDLSAINEKTKPARKSSAEKRKEKEEKRKQGQQQPKVAEKPATAATESTAKPPAEVKVEAKAEPSAPPDKQPEKEKSNFMETKFEKLAGVNIVGKIDLPEKKKPVKKKPVASSTDDKINQKRKKRKRIKKEEKPRVQGKDTPQNQTQNKNKPQGQATDAQKARTTERNARNKKRRFEPKAELSEEDVQKQIKETLARLSGAGKSKSSKHRKAKRDYVHKQREQEDFEKEVENKSVITVAEFVTANELATMMKKGVTEIISVCMQLGLFVSINQRLDAETISLVAEEFGFSVKFESAETAIGHEDEEEDNPEDLRPRSPIVTVMGHVDHGKTKLLDYIRSANVVAGEAGGITQHIGAYEVELEKGKKITFLDTPGHEAFTAMRARGAKVTDVAIIVIAADDSVMPQTVEAINHAQAANVPIVFAINKIDKPTANPERIKDQLSQMNILVEDWGGKFQSQEISAKGGLNIDDLLEKVSLESEMLDLKANPSRLAYGTIIESALDKGRGYVSTLLVQNGTLKIGDLVLAGSHYGRVKAMYNERNQPITEAGPSAPVLMLGINGAPQAGDSFKAMKDEREAKNIASKRQQLQREQGLRTQKHITLDEIGRRIAIGDFQELNIIVKGDVDGSVEALSDSLIKLGNEEIQVNVIHKSVGPVTETDVMLASASNAVIVAFQVRPSLAARKLAEKEEIDIRTYSIIYSAIEEIKAAIEGMLSPDIQEKITCNIEVRETFKITKVGTIAGCYVLDGTVNRNTRIRIIRDGIVVYTGKLGSLKRFKDDVKEVQSGYECGLNIENFNDIKVGDIIEGFEEIKVARKLD